MNSSKGNGFTGKFTMLEVFERRLDMRKEEECGREKQRRPWETERRVAWDSRGPERERDALRQALRLVS